MKRIICLGLTVILLLLSLASCNKDEQTPPAFDEIDFTEVTDFSKVSVSDTETDYVIIEVEKFGSIVVRLFPDVAPQTVANFKKLVSEKFYDGLIFHRVIKNFMIQGGDPLGNGTGGSDEKIFGEFSDNGFENNLKHVRGVISMARSDDQNPLTTEDMNSASSQFFICQRDYSYGNGSYAAFGYVVYGIDVVDEIASVRTNASDKPVSPVTITSIRFANVSK